MTNMYKDLYIRFLKYNVRLILDNHKLKTMRFSFGILELLPPGFNESETFLYYYGQYVSRSVEADTLLGTFGIFKESLVEK